MRLPQLQAVLLLKLRQVPCKGTQPVVAGAVQVPAGSMVDRQLPVFVGFKKRVAEEETSPSASSRKTHRSNNSDLQQERLDEVIQPLVDCIAACVQQNEIVAMAIGAMPLVAATLRHAQMLAMIDENVTHLRDCLRAASEAVQACDSSQAERVSFQSLNLMQLAAKQRKMIHRDLGNFYNSENASWLIETQVKTTQNCLNKDPQYRKCLLSHRQLELLLETLSASMMEKHQEIAFDMSRLQRGALPLKLTCAKRHQQAKQHQNEDLGLDEYELTSDSVLLVKALEVGYVSDLDKATRLQTVTGAWQKLLSVISVAEIVQSLKSGLVTLLQHLRTMDAGRRLYDRTSGTLASENYDMWVWITKAKP